MTETWKMYIWMGIALIDTYIIIKDTLNKGGKSYDRRFVSRSKRK